MTKVERSICKSNILFAQAVEQLSLVFGSSAMNSHGSHKQRLWQRVGKSQSRAVREPGGAKVNAARRILDAFRVAVCPWTRMSFWRKAVLLDRCSSQQHVTFLIVFTNVVDPVGSGFVASMSY